ncbi:MAG: DUF72 domain-containing protein [Rubricoccaceae bacterium]|nr:DUF72 domain-containing protein [Rubricoccaceae bacterium]
MSARRPVPERRADLGRYDLRGVHPRLRFGTASDRFAAWIDQVYPRDVWAGEVSTRTKRVGGEGFEERLLPVASVEDYFLHFGVLELDFTFYRPLLEPDGRSGPALFTLQAYAEHAPANARFLLKAPQAFAAQRLRRTVDGRPQFVDNPDYLDAEGFTGRFLAPALDTLGADRLAGVLFEQAYARVRESPPPEAFVAELDGFFAEVPDTAQVHLEIRSPHLLTPPYLAWLEARGLGFVFSHWTWLPSLREQWGLAGERFTAANGEAVLRLLTPREMKFDESYRRAYPFEGPAASLADTPEARQMVDEATALLYKAVEADVTVNAILNNRAWGNAPDLARTLANRFLDFADRFEA